MILRKITGASTTGGTNAGAEPAPNPALAYNPDLTVIDGQSNASGAALIADLPGDLAGVMPGVVVFNVISNKWEPLLPGTNNRGTTGVNATGGSDVATGYFGAECRIMKTLQADRGVAQYLVKYTMGDSPLAAEASFTDWSTANQENYLRSNANVAKCIQALGDKRPPRFYIWLQGETDATLTRSAAYEVNLTNYINAKRTALGYATMPFICVLLGDGQTGYNATYLEAVNTAKVNVAAALDDVYLVDADGLATYDTFHFTAASYETLAQRILDVIDLNNL